MTENYLLEDSSGTILLENGTDNYRLDFPILVKDESVGVTEVNQSIIVKIKNILDTVGVTESVNKFTGFVKVATQFILSLEGVNNRKTREFAYVFEDGTNDAYLLEDGTGIYLQNYPLKVTSQTVGLVEASQGTKGLLEQISEIVGLTVASQAITGFVKVATQFIATVEESINRLLTDVNVYAREDGTGSYLTEDGSGFYELNQLQILQLSNFTVGITGANQKYLGPVKTLTDQVNVVEVINRARVMFRNAITTIVGITEASNSGVGIIRNILTTVDLTESKDVLLALVRNASSTVGLTGTINRLRGRLQNITSTVGLTEVRNTVTGIVKEIAETIGLTELINRIRTVFISNNIGDFISMDAVDTGTFTAIDSKNINDMTAIDSYNSGDYIIRDDD